MKLGELGNKSLDTCKGAKVEVHGMDVGIEGFLLQFRCQFLALVELATCQD